MFSSKVQNFARSDLKYTRPVEESFPSAIFVDSHQRHSPRPITLAPKMTTVLYPHNSNRKRNEGLLREGRFDAGAEVGVLRLAQGDVEMAARLGRHVEGAAGEG